MDAAVVEFQSLADPVGSRTKDDDLFARRRVGLILAVVRRVQIGGEGLELGRAGIDGFEHRPDFRLAPAPGNLLFAGPGQLRNAAVGESPGP